MKAGLLAIQSVAVTIANPAFVPSSGAIVLNTASVKLFYPALAQLIPAFVCPHLTKLEMDSPITEALLHAVETRFPSLVSLYISSLDHGRRLPTFGYCFADRVTLALSIDEAGGSRKYFLFINSLATLPGMKRMASESLYAYYDRMMCLTTVVEFCSSAYSQHVDMVFSACHMTTLFVNGAMSSASASRLAFGPSGMSALHDVDFRGHPKFDFTGLDTVSVVPWILDHFATFHSLTLISSHPIAPENRTKRQFPSLACFKTNRGEPCFVGLFCLCSPRSGTLLAVWTNFPIPNLIGSSLRSHSIHTNEATP